VTADLDLANSIEEALPAQHALLPPKAIGLLRPSKGILSPIESSVLASFSEQGAAPGRSAKANRSAPHRLEGREAGLRNASSVLLAGCLRSNLREHELGMMRLMILVGSLHITQIEMLSLQGKPLHSVRIQKLFRSYPSMINSTYNSLATYAQILQLHVKGLYNSPFTYS
jgi:hypothetical protein